MLKREYSLISDNIGKAILAFVLPMMLGSLIQQLYTMTDAVVVGQFTGKQGLAAIDSVHTLFKFPINFMNGLASGATILISDAFGAKDHRKLNDSIQTALAVAIVLGLLGAAGGVVLSPSLLRILSVPKDIFQQTLLYTRIYFGGLWAMVLYNMAAGVLRALGDTRRPLYVLIVCCVMNVLGDLLLVGMFRLGVAGAAAATVAAQIVSVICTLWFLNRSLENGILGTEGFRVPKEKLLSMMRTGLPLAIQSMLFPIANTIVQAGVNQMGTDSIAAWGICGKLDMLIWLLADAMSPALTTYTAQNIGAKQLHRVKEGNRIGAAMSAGAVAIVSIILYFGSGVFGSWFLSEQDGVILLPLVVHFMTMMCPFYIFYAVAEAFSGACCGMGDTLRPMLTTMITICLLRVLGIWFILPHYRTMDCIVWIYVASWIAAGVAFSVMYTFKIRKLTQFAGNTAF